MAFVEYTTACTVCAAPPIALRFYVYLPHTNLYCANKREVGPATSTTTTIAQQQDDNTFIFVYIGNTARANLPRWLQQNVAIVIFKFL